MLAVQGKLETRRNRGLPIYLNSQDRKNLCKKCILPQIALEFSLLQRKEASTDLVDPNSNSLIQQTLL